MPKSKFGLKFSLVLKIVLLISYQDPKFLFNYQLLILRYEGWGNWFCGVLEERDCRPKIGEAQKGCALREARCQARKEA